MHRIVQRVLPRWNCVCVRVCVFILLKLMPVARRGLCAAARGRAARRARARVAGRPARWPAAAAAPQASRPHLPGTSDGRSHVALRARRYGSGGSARRCVGACECVQDLWKTGGGSGGGGRGSPSLAAEGRHAAAAPCTRRIARTEARTLCGAASAPPTAIDCRDRAHCRRSLCTTGGA